MLNDSPFLMRDTLADSSALVDYMIPVGLIREFTVCIWHSLFSL